MLIPAAAPLGLLHEVIQIVMNWDGDHLHAVSVRDERYGDPSTVRPTRRGQPTAQRRIHPTKTITYRYGFGVSWDHDITREKVLDLDPDTT